MREKLQALLRRYRLVVAGFVTPPIGQWSDRPAYRNLSGEIWLHFRRLRPDGSYEYRRATVAEVREHSAAVAW